MSGIPSRSGFREDLLSLKKFFHSALKRDKLLCIGGELINSPLSYSRAYMNCVFGTHILIGEGQKGRRDLSSVVALSRSGTIKQMVTGGVYRNTPGAGTATKKAKKHKFIGVEV